MGRINNLDSKFSTRNKGKNMNTASAMMLGKRKRANATKQKKKKKSPAANGGGGTPLIPKNEIAILKKENQKIRHQMKRCHRRIILQKRKRKNHFQKKRKRMGKKLGGFVVGFCVLVNFFHF